MIYGSVLILSAPHVYSAFIGDDTVGGRNIAGQKQYKFIGFLVMMLKEVFIGFCIGFVLLELFLIADMLGRLVDLLRGTTMATALVPELKERSSVFGNMSYQLFLVIFLSIGGHRYFLGALFTSFAAIPVTEMPQFASAGMGAFAGAGWAGGAATVFGSVSWDSLLVAPENSLPMSLNSHSMGLRNSGA